MNMQPQKHLQYSSAAVQQAREDRNRFNPFRRRDIDSRRRQQARERGERNLNRWVQGSERSSIDLEAGSHAPSESATACRTTSGRDVTADSTLRVKVANDGIPYERYAQYHLPPEGTPLQIRNDPAGPIPEHQDRGSPPHQNQIAPDQNHESKSLPELSEYLQNDDPASQSRRAQKLLRASQRVAKSAKGNLFYPIRDPVDRTKTRKYVLNVSAMQAAALRYYQTMIVEYGAEMYRGGVYAEMPDLLHKYCESNKRPRPGVGRMVVTDDAPGDALRDMDYMQEKARNGFDNDPFLLMTTKQMEREMMLDSGLISEQEFKTSLPEAIDKHNPVLPGVGRTARVHATEAKARTINLLCALLGGLALIVPMVIMKLVPWQTSVLVVTCAFVLAFAFVVALLSGLRPNEVLTATAAYAAVLVVFVGAQSPVRGGTYVLRS